MSFEGWYLLLGGVMLAVVFAEHWLKRLPLTITILYLLCGACLGPLWFGFIQIDPVARSSLIERATELAVIVSLFTTGLKLNPQVWLERKQLVLRLAFISMTATVGLIAFAGYFLLKLPIGAAVLLGAVLAPTDPVLASDVQLKHPEDKDRLRFSLTGEAGMNDGTAFPFVMLGLGLLGLHPLGPWGVKWVVVDVIWAISAGLGIGWVAGRVVGKGILRLQQLKTNVERDEFIALGLIAFAYGLALICKAYGFLAVFAAGLALRRVQFQSMSKNQDAKASERSDPNYIAGALLSTNEGLERLLEIGVVVLLGGMLSKEILAGEAFWFAPLLFLVIRPISVFLGIRGCPEGSMERGLVSWFGIRGIGSLYYLMYAVTHGVPEELAQRLTSIVLTVVAVSILVHGVSVTPIMNFYERRARKREK